MKIALFHNYYRLPGGEDVMFEMEQRALREAGHEVCTFTLHSREELDGASFLKKAGVAWRSAYNSVSEARILEFLREERPDVGHVHNWFPLFSPSIYAAHRSAGVPVVQTLHNYRLGCANGTFRRDGKTCHDCTPLRARAAVSHRCYRGSLTGSLAWKRMVDRNWSNGTFTSAVDAYLCPSREVAQQHEAMGLPQSRLWAVPNACEDPLPQGVAPTAPARNRALFVGRLVEEKGAGVLLEAWARCVGQMHGPAPELEMLGSGPDAADLKARFGHLPGVHFRGQVSREAVSAALQRTGVLVFPSIWAEPFGLGVIEAMGAGRPVIASDLGGPAELIEDGVNGQLVAPNDPDALSAALLKTFRSTSRQTSMGVAARTQYEERFTPGAHVDQLLEVYASVTGSKNPSPLADRPGQGALAS